MSIKDLEIPIALNTSKDNLVNDFFVPLLKESIQYDRGVGYFSSGWIKENFEGMSGFASNGGKARWITSPILSKEDWDALLLGSNAKEDELLKDALEREIETLARTLKQGTLVALSWMVADEIIDFKLAKPRNKLSSEYHAKVGIFTDTYGASISFDGSYNDSINGLYNFESLKVFRSWDSSNSYVEHEKKLFEMIWNNQDPNIEVFNIPDAAKQKILKLRENTPRPYPRPDWIKIDTLKNNFEEVKIPVPSLPSKIKLRGYQKEAIENWKKNNYRGIFEMATGTGKTITALSASVQLFQEKKELLTIVTTPYTHLSKQWQKEMEHFGYRPLLVAESRKKWLEKTSLLIRDVKAGRLKHASLVTTNASFLKSSLREILDKYNVWNKVLFIADEMHHCGSQEMLKTLPPAAPYRLGLSATPVRTYDEFGTQQLIDYFGDVVYEFGLEQAIEQGFLTPYFYHPIPVHLYDDEFAEFVSLSKKLSRMFQNSDEPISEAALKIAIKRARVLNNTQSKLDWVRENINADEDHSHTLFYVGDQIFAEARKLIGFEKKIPAHEFTHRQNLKKRGELLTQFADKRVQVLIAMKCLDEGVDVPPTRRAYFLASSSVSREFIQRRGRVLRKYEGKEFAEIYDLISVPPEEYLSVGKYSKEYNIVRSALRREFLRVREFASLAENKYQALDLLSDMADDFDLLDI